MHTRKCKRRRKCTYCSGFGGWRWRKRFGNGMKYILIMIEFWKRRKKVSGGKGRRRRKGRGRKRILTHKDVGPQIFNNPVETHSDGEVVCGLDNTGLREPEESCLRNTESTSHCWHTWKRDGALVPESRDPKKACSVCRGYWVRACQT
jgi:hypothetical protein